MLIPILNLAVSLALVQVPPANFACSVLTPAQVSSLIGTAKTLPMNNLATGSTCMFQNNDKLITVFVATNTTADAAQRLFDSKKRIATGAEIAGWGIPAYRAAMKNAAASGVLKQLTFVEVMMSDSAQKPDAMAQKLQAVMKDFAARK